MNSAQPSPLQTLCELARQLVHSRGEVDAEVLLVLSDRAQQLGLPPQSVDAAIDSLSGRPAVVDAVPVPQQSNPLPTAIPVAQHESMPEPPPIAEELPLAAAIPHPSDAPAAIVPSTPQEPLIATPVSGQQVSESQQPEAAPAIQHSKAAAATQEKPQAPAKPPRKAPAERFRQYVDAQLAPRTGKQIASREVEYLVGQGVKQTGLSEFYAEDIVVEACRSHSVALPSQEPAVADPDVKAFADYCQQVLAIEAGMTPQARVKIDAKAQELKLSSEQREQAVALMDTKIDPNRLQRRATSFEQYLGAALAKTKRVLPDAHQRLEQTGVELFGLLPDVANRLISEVAKANSVKVFTKDAAAELLNRSISAATDGRTALESAEKTKLIEEGRRIGLTEEEASRRIEAQLDRNREETRAKQKMDRMILMTLAFVVAVFVVGAAAGIYYVTIEPKKLAEKETESEDTPTSPQWWNAELILAVEDAKRLIPAAKSDLQSLGSGIIVARRNSCEGLVRQFDRLLNDQADAAAQVDDEGNRRRPASDTKAEKSLAALRAVLVQAYVVEPDKSVRNVWLTELLKPLSPEAATTLRDQSFALLFERLDVAMTALDSKSVSEAAKSELVSALDESIPGPADNYRGRLTMHLRDQVQGEAPDVARAFDNFIVLLLNARKTLPKDQQSAFADDLLVQELMTLDQSLGSFADVVERQLRGGDSLLISRFVEVYQKMPAGGAQDQLASLLLDAVHLSPQPNESPEKIAAAIRQELLAMPSEDGDPSDGWNRWRQRSQLMLAQPRADSDDAGGVLTEAANLARHFAIGEAIAEAERRPEGNASAVSEELSQLGEFTPPNAIQSGRTTSTTARDSDTYMPKLYEYYGRLMQARDQRMREIILRTVFVYSTYIDEIKPDVAATLVQYTLHPKSQSEQDMIVQNIGTWMRWKYYRLALADALQGINQPPATIKALLEPVIGKEIDLTDKQWKLKTRVDLMETARDRFQLKTASNSDDSTIDAAGQYMAEVLKLKSRLRGHVPDPQQEMAAVPGQILSSTSQAYAQRLSGVAEPAAQEMLHRGNRRRELASYLSNNDLGQTAAEQRAYLRLLAADMIEAKPALEKQVSELFAQLDDLDQGSKSLFAQLRDAELVGIKLLMLRGATQ